MGDKSPRDLQQAITDETSALTEEEKKESQFLQHYVHQRGSVLILEKLVSVGNAKITDDLLDKHFPDEDDPVPQISSKFTEAMSCVIILNCIIIGVECQWPGTEDERLQLCYEVANWIFLACYMFEVGLKLKMKGFEDYFGGRQKKWNYLDFGLTVFMFFHAINVVPRKLTTLASTLRTVRIVRILKVLRQVKMLSIVVGGMSESLSTLCWIVVLLVLLVYSFGIFFTLSFIQEEEDREGRRLLNNKGDFGTADQVYPGCDEEVEDIALKFDSLVKSIITLTDMVMGGTWGDVVNPVIDNYPQLLPAFFIFVAIATLGLLNLIVGVICDATSNTKNKIEWQAKRESLQALSNMWLHQIREQEDDLSQKTISKIEDSGEKKRKEEARKKQIQHILKAIINEQIVAFPAGTDEQQLYEMLDTDGRGELSHEEFVVGVGRILLGDSFQLNCLQLVNQGLARKLSRLNATAMEKNHTALDEIQKTLKGITDRLDNIEQKLAK